ncbi:MAG: Sec-independent protein translocase protein TatB, partial [Pseudomonadota bacterium]
VFDLGWSEMAIIMLVALVVIGPKDLPRLARTLGQWVAKGRAMARDFQRSLEDMAREAELDDVKREIEKVGRTNVRSTIEKTIDPTGELGKAFKVDEDKDQAEAKSATSNGKAKTEDPAPSAPEPSIEAKPAEPEPEVTPEPKVAAAAKPAPTEPKVEATPKPAPTQASETATMVEPR